MTNSEMRFQIEESAGLCRLHGMSVSINRGLPWVDVYLGPDEEFFFQEHEADELLRDADAAAAKFACAPEDYILHAAQGW